MRRTRGWKAFLASGLVLTAVGCSNEPTTSTGLDSRLLPPSTLASVAQTLLGQTTVCMEDVVEAVDGTNAVPLNCTANDLNLFFTIPSGSSALPLCLPGDALPNLDVEAHFAAGASERFDIGLWIRNDNLAIPNALRGQCKHWSLVPPEAIEDAASGNPDLAPFFNGDGDTCGDLKQNIESVLPITLSGLTCRDSDGDGFLDIGACVSYDNNSNTANQCTDAATAPSTTRPNTKSKCACGPLGIPVRIAGRIIIEKQTLPDGSAQSFSFTGTAPGGANFPGLAGNLTDGQQISVNVEAGTYTSTEGAVAGWDLTSLVCTDPTTNSSVDVATRTATIVVASGETVTCVFTNTKQPILRIDKVTVPAGDAQSFTFTPTGFNGGSTFNLADATTPFSSGAVSVGSYSVSETVPAGWDLTNRACVLTGTATAKAFTGSAPSLTVNLLAGEDVTCTFTNTKRAILRIDKVTVPAGDATSFTFTPTGYNSGSTFNLADATTPFSSGAVIPGSYTATETVPAGWDLTNRACVLTGTATAKTFTGSSPAVTVSLLAGEDVTCTFTNTKRAIIRIDKVTSPAGDAQSFTFTPTGFNGGSTFNLADATTPFSSGAIVPGSVSVIETEPAGWALTNRACVLTGTATAKTFTGSSPTITVNLLAGEDVTCTFTNTKAAILRIDKVTVPAGDAQSFTFTPTGYNGGSTFNLADASTPFSSGALTPGSYSAAETVPAGWDLTNRACVLTGTATAKTFTGSAPGVTVELLAGEDVTCTFTNTKRAIIRIDKVTAPAGDAQSFTFTPTGYNGGSTFNLADATTPFSSGAIVPGSVSVSETVPAGWDLTGRACVLTGTATAKTFTGSAPSVTVELLAGEDVTCTFTNTERAILRIDKVTDPAGSATSFTFTPTGYNGGATFNLADATTPFSSGAVVPGSYTATETVPAGWALTTRACVLTGTATAKTFTGSSPAVTVNLLAGEDVTCTFTNTQHGTVTVNKHEGGVVPLVHSWSFEIRSGATTLAAGTVEATGTAVIATGVVNFACSPDDANCDNVGGIANLVPGNYQLCETGMPAGYSNNMTGFTPAGAAAEGADNSVECVNFTLAAGASGIPTGVPNPFIDNTPPPGGDARTIGYWKNWSSCSTSKGSQFEKATAKGFATLDANLPQTIGDLLVDTCAEGVSILNKSDVDTGKKQASDAAYGLAAQLLAAKLNVSAGAGTCQAALDAISGGQALLDAIGFIGTGTYLKEASADRTAALGFAATLDDYNNNELCPPAP